MTDKTIPFSVLDLAPIPEGSSAKEAFTHSLDPANTTTLHLGSGGVMLPNHSPLVIAEQFGTLNTLYPGRIDLGLGRAPGSDQPTMRALRRHMSGDIDNFPRDVAELVDWFDARDPNPHVRPVPGYGEQSPAWPAVRLCFAFRAGYVVPGAASVPYPVQTFSAAGKTVRDGVYQYYRRRQQPRRRIPVYLHAAGFREATPWGNRPTAAAD